MKSILKTCMLSCVACLWMTTAAIARPPAQSGEIDLDQEVSDKNTTVSGLVDVDLKQKKRVRKDPYQVAQDSAIDYFKSVVDKTDALKTGDSNAVRRPQTNETLHLNGLYLYCSIHNGTCPEVLDAILELDVINSKLSGKAQCPITIQFWKSWISNKLEKRHQHHVKTGFMSQTTRFKKDILPRYLKCSKTVQEELDKGPKETLAFFKARYGSESLKKDTLSQMVEKLEAMKEHVPDVFIETE